MGDDTQRASGSRAIRIPSRARDESEYEALRDAKRSGNADDLEREILVSERGIVRTARAAADAGVDPEPILLRLRQPCSSLGVDAADVYELRRDRRVPPDEPFRIDAESVAELADRCQAAIQALDCPPGSASRPEVDEWEGLEMADVTAGSEVDDVCVFLRLLVELCDLAREFGLPLEVKKTA